MKVSIVMPIYDEARTIEEIISLVQSVPIEKEIILVDDGSTDGTTERLKNLQEQGNLRILYHSENRGKGAALRTGFRYVTGDIVIIQDADLEADPREYPNLLKPILAGRADVVYGSRFLRSPRKERFSISYAANRFLTGLSNLVNDLDLTDMETCYKVFRRDILDVIRVKSNRFEFEPEFTAKIARRKYRICEVPINYSPRTYSEGKKIAWKDGLKAIFAIFWFRFFD